MSITIKKIPVTTKILEPGLVPVVQTRYLTLQTLDCNGQTYVDSSNFPDIFEIPADAIERFLENEEGVSMDMKMHYLYSSLVKPDLRLEHIDEDSKFVRPSTIVQLLVLNKARFAGDACEVYRKMIVTEFPDADVTDLSNDVDFKNKMNEIGKIVTGDAGGMNYHNFQSALFSLLDFSKIENYRWVGSYVKDLCTLDFDRVYTIFENYDKYLKHYEMITTTTRIIMFMHSNIKKRGDDPGKRGNKMMTFVSYQLPLNDPFFALSKKLLTRNVKNYKLKDERSAMLTKMKLTEKMNYAKIAPTGQKKSNMPSKESFDVDNAGELFRSDFLSKLVFVKFALELANREVCERSGYIIKLDV